MPVNRNALIRYKTIDNCLKNKYRQWTLEDLIDACSDALYEYEGIDKGISKRTVQMDIQMMRSEKLGYNAPIVVYDKRYYKYEDEDYSITDTPLNEQDLKTMSEAVEILRQFKGFSHFVDMGEIVNRLEDHVTSVNQSTSPVIDFEKNEDLRGLAHLDTIYSAIINKRVLRIEYKSFKARDASSFLFYSYLLKEYRNRWFVFGKRGGSGGLVNLALDRILDIKIEEKEKYRENDLIDTQTFFDDVIGVTKNIGMVPQVVKFWVDAPNAPYIETKPFHKSQRVIEVKEDGSKVFEINVVINHELERVILGFGEFIKVVSPRHFVNLISKKIHKAAQAYEKNEGE